MSFSGAINDFSKIVDKALDDFAREITTEIAGSVIDLSPVDSSRFVKNWQHGTNAQPIGEVEEARNLPKGQSIHAMQAAAKLNMAAKLQNVKFGGIEYIVNNVPYAERLEFGYSGQAPSGMVRVTFSKLNKLVRNAANKVTKR